MFDFKKLKEIRKDGKLHIGKICETLGISRATYWRWEEGTIAPPNEKIIKLANFLNISISKISDIAANAEIYDKIGSIGFLATPPTTDEEFKKISDIINQLLTINTKFKEAKMVVSAIVNAMTSMIYIKDDNQKYIMANDAFKKNLSLPENMTIKGKTDFDFFPFHDATLNHNRDAHVFKTETSVTEEGYIPGAKRKKWGLFSKVPLLDERGRIIGTVGVITDITEKKLAEQKILLLKNGLDIVGTGISVIDYNTRELYYMNQAGRAIHNLPEDAIVKHTEEQFINQVHPEDREKVLKHAKKLASDVEYRLLRPDGSITWVHGRKYFHEFNAKKFSISMFEDITSKKEIMQQVMLLKSGIESLEDGVIFIDITNGLSCYVNQAHEKITGYPAETFIGMSVDFWLDNIVHPDDRKEQKKYLTSKEFPGRRSYRIIKKDGEVRHVESIRSVNPFTYEQKKWNVVIIRDVTEQKIEQDALRSFEKVSRVDKEDEELNIFRQTMNIMEDGIVVVESK